METTFLNNIITKYLNFKLQQKYHNNYNPNNNNVKYLVLMACHCNSELKLSAINRNLKYLDYESIDVVLINSVGLPYNSQISNLCSQYKNIKYNEIPNESTYDFGKWVYGLNKCDYNNYDYTIFINDSFIIHSHINHFFNLVYKYNTEFYGYNDSTQERYHYQSYLFALRKDAIPIFIKNYKLKKYKVKTFQDVITQYELTMTDWFKTQNCFLKIGTFNINRGKNIFFTNDILYRKLKETALLPFTKIKRII
jgi:hypothetical protein